MVEWDDPDFDPHKVDAAALTRNLASLAKFLGGRRSGGQAAE